MRLVVVLLIAVVAGCSGGSGAVDGGQGAGAEDPAASRLDGLQLFPGGGPVRCYDYRPSRGASEVRRHCVAGSWSFPSFSWRAGDRCADDGQVMIGRVLTSGPAAGTQRFACEPRYDCDVTAIDNPACCDEVPFGRGAGNCENQAPERLR